MYFFNFQTEFSAFIGTNIRFFVIYRGNFVEKNLFQAYKGGSMRKKTSQNWLHEGIAETFFVNDIDSPIVRADEIPILANLYFSG